MQKFICSIFFIVCLMPANSQEVIKITNGALMKVQPGAVLTILGDANLDNGSILHNDGIIRIQRFGSSGSGNWTDQTAGSYHHGGGTLLFNSNTVQNISTPNVIKLVMVENAGLNLLSTIRSDFWTLTTGAVTTGINFLHAQSPLESAISAHPSNINFTNSWINGNIRRNIDPLVSNVYEFPTGSAVRVNRIRMENLSANPLTGVTYIDAAFGPKPGSDLGLLVSEGGTPFTSVHSEGVWYLNPDAVPTSGKFDVRVYFNGYTGLQDNRFAILNRPSSSTNAADWKVPAGSAISPSNGAGRKVADGFALRFSVPDFGQFGLGLTSVSLPVTLLNFNANRVGRNSVSLSWQTATEAQNLGFEILRKHSNEVSFRPVSFVPTKAVDGNSSVDLFYSFHDGNDYTGVSYYRLNQKDINGQSKYSEIKAVSGDKESVITVWPNPATIRLNIRFEGSSLVKIGIVTDAAGKTVKQVNIQNSTELDVSDLPSGIYFIQVRNAFGLGEHFSEKFVIRR